MRNAAARSLGGKSLAQFAVCRHAPGDQNALRIQRLSRGEGLLHQVADHGVLKAGDEIERRLRTQRQCFFLCLRRPAGSQHPGHARLQLPRAIHAVRHTATRRS